MSNLKFTVIFKICRFLLKLGDRHYAFWPFITYSRGKIELNLFFIVHKQHYRKVVALNVGWTWSFTSCTLTNGEVKAKSNVLRSAHNIVWALITTDLAFPPIISQISEFQNKDLITSDFLFKENSASSFWNSCPIGLYAFFYHLASSVVTATCFVGCISRTHVPTKLTFSPPYPQYNSLSHI